MDKLFHKHLKLTNLGLKEQQRCKKPCDIVSFRDRMHRLRLLKLEMLIDLRNGANR